MTVAGEPLRAAERHRQSDRTGCLLKELDVSCHNECTTGVDTSCPLLHVRPPGRSKFRFNMNNLQQSMTFVSAASGI